MPSLLEDDAVDQNGMLVGRVGAFQFSAVGIDRLGATEYTIVDINVDVSGSVAPFSDELLEMLKMAVRSCKKSSRSANLLVRVCLFSTIYPKGVLELHGFKLLSDINPDTDYRTLRPGGGTPLFDAVYAGVGAINGYAAYLQKNDFLANAISITITDGGDTDSASTPGMIAEEIERTVSSEVVESLVSILIGINASHCRSYLNRFKSEGRLTHYVDAGDATPGKLAKLAGYISQSISSQSQSLGSGGPSKAIAPTI